MASNLHLYTGLRTSLYPRFPTRRSDPIEKQMTFYLWRAMQHAVVF